ncbi:MAG TPA: oxidoreductase [Thermoplasmatales archaeon]|nr:oxidoreductase [Thermoplasmatales archaeon]
MTGPEYAEKYISQAIRLGVQFMRETMVLSMDRKRHVVAVNSGGVHHISARAIILATGCREKTRWHAMIPGTRPSGIYTAGVAQALINLYNIIPGKRVVILGSGDVGLIMARRLTLEGSHVEAVVEILPYASGLPRNVVQCLEDYDIPLFLSHTITAIDGRERLEKVTISRVDEHMKPIPGSEKEIECDTLLLSLGLIPENELSRVAGVTLDSATGGPLVNQDFETSVEGIFACGNCLQVYDSVDMLSFDAKRAGRRAAESTLQEKERQMHLRIVPSSGVRYVIPQRVDRCGKIQLSLRVQKPGENKMLRVTAGENEILKKRLPWVNPATMIKVDLTIQEGMELASKRLEVTLDDQ